MARACSSRVKTGGFNEPGQVGAPVDQGAQRGEIALDGVDGFLVLGQFENGVRVATRQSGFLCLFRCHVRPSAPCAAVDRASRLNS